MRRVYERLSLGLTISALLLVVSPATSVETTVLGTITKIVDGDTVWVTPRGTSRKTPSYLKVRMLHMDTPETHLVTSHGVQGQQPWGDEATAALEQMVPLKTSVKLVTAGTDKYGRVLGRIVVGDLDVNLEMVRQGWASPYIICEGKGCNPGFFERENIAEYIGACQEARHKKLGIWNTKNPLTELAFEFRLRMQNRRPDKHVGNFESNEYVAPSNYTQIDVCNRIFFMQESDAKHSGYTPASRVEDQFLPISDLMDSLAHSISQE